MESGRRVAWCAMDSVASLTAGAFCLTASHRPELLPFTQDAASRVVCLAGAVIGRFAPWAPAALLAVGILAWFAVGARRAVCGALGAFLAAAAALMIMAVFHGCYEGMLYERQATQCAERFQPLVEALGAYGRDHGVAPPDLAALVPRYLPRVPQPGLWCSTPFIYEAKNGTPGAQPDPVPPAEAWRLSFWVACGSGVDEVDYVPHGARGRRSHWGRPHPDGDGGRWGAVHYDAAIGPRFILDRWRGTPPRPPGRLAQGGETERVGRWAYVHE